MSVNVARFISIFGAVLMAISFSALPGCSGGGRAEERVNEARDLIGSSQELLEDLGSLDARFNALGTRFPKVEDTIAEGKSLAEMAFIDLDELETRYARARDLLFEVTNMQGAGDYADYSSLALQAVENKLEEFGFNRELLTSISDMLDVLPLAQNAGQLSYYEERINELNGRISEARKEAAAAAADADQFFKEHDL